MKKLNILFLLFIKTISKLIFVHTHFRHGHRGSSKGGFKGSGKDYININWLTESELTGIGIRQEYILGFNTRIKYKNFLSKNYNPNEILVYSTFINRALDSGYSYLNGLYSFNFNNENINKKKQSNNNKKLYNNQKSKKNQNINFGSNNNNLSLTKQQIKNSFPLNLMNKDIELEIKKLGKLPLPNGLNVIPIHIFNRKDKDFLLSAPINCKPVSEIRKNISKSNLIKNSIKDFKRKYKIKLDYFFKLKNINFKYDFLQILDFCDNFISDLIQFIELNDFYLIANITFKNLKDDCYKIFKINLENYQFGNKNLIFISQTPVIKNLINYMEKRIEIEEGILKENIYEKYPKFLIYSGHDSSLIGIMLWMKELFNCKTFLPLFGTSIYFELYKNDNLTSLKGNFEDYFIKYFINDEELINLNFKEFKEISEKYFWSDKEINDYCKFDIVNLDVKKYEIKIYLFIIFIMIVLSLIMFYYFIDLYFKIEGKKKIENKEKELEEIFEENK